MRDSLSVQCTHSLISTHFQGVELNLNSSTGEDTAMPDTQDTNANNQDNQPLSTLSTCVPCENGNSVSSGKLQLKDERKICMDSSL